MNVSERIIVARKVAAGEFNDRRFTLKQQIDEFLDELRWGRALRIDPLWAKAQKSRRTKV